MTICDHLSRGMGTRVIWPPICGKTNKEKRYETGGWHHFPCALGQGAYIMISQFHNIIKSYEGVLIAWNNDSRFLRNQEFPRGKETRIREESPKECNVG